jgi:hypothetical protein
LFDVSSLPKKTCAATILFRRKTIRVEDRDRITDRTSVQCNASKPTAPKDGATIAIFNDHPD